MSLSKPVDDKWDRLLACLLEIEGAIDKFKHAPPTHRNWEAIARNIKNMKTHRNWALNKVKQATADLKRLHEETAQANEDLITKEAPPHLQKVLRVGGTRNVLAMGHLIKKHSHPDTKLWEAVLKGFKTLGDLDRSYVWELKEGNLAISDEDAGAFWKLPINIPKKPTKTEAGSYQYKLMAKIRDLALEKEAQGRYKRITQEQLMHTPAPAFPKDESDLTREKIRELVDATEHNKFKTLSEHMRFFGTRHIIHMFQMWLMPAGRELEVPAPALSQATKETFSAVPNQVLRAAEKVTAPLPKATDLLIHATLSRIQNKLAKTSALQHHPTGGQLPEAGSDDIKDAYPCLGAEDPNAHPLAVFDPDARSWIFYIQYCLGQGDLASVPAFCRLSELINTIATGDGVPLGMYIDDANYTAPDPEFLAACKAYYIQLLETLGVPRGTKAKADQSSVGTDQVRALGIIYRWCRDTGIITGEIPEGTLEKGIKYCLQAKELLIQGELTPDLMQRVVGVANHVAQHTVNKEGSQLVNPLYGWTTDLLYDLVKDRTERAALSHRLENVVKFLMNHQPSIIIRAKLGVRQRLGYTQTDASTDGINGNPALCGIHFDHTGQRKAFAVELDIDFLTELFGKCPPSGKEWYSIDTLEVMAAALADELYGTTSDTTIAEIDNTGGLFCLTKLTSSKMKNANMAAHAAWRNVAEERTTLRRYVNTRFNLADFGTRGDLMGALREYFQVAGKEVLPPPCMVETDLYSRGQQALREGH